MSYVWGNDDLVDRIEANGRALWITETLFSALSHLRYLDQDRILWIDAICIDQANNVEKSSQVQAMGEIFRSAKQVIFLAWQAYSRGDASHKLFEWTRDAA